MPPRLGCALNATEVLSSRRNLNLVYTQVNENTFLLQTLRPIRSRDKYDEAARCPGGSLVEIPATARVRACSGVRPAVR